MKPQSAFIIFVIVTDLILLISFFLFAVLDKPKVSENSEKSEKLAENLRDVCADQKCVRFCNNYSANEKNEFYSSASATQADHKNEFIGEPCDEMEIFDISHWNVTIMMVREMSSCVHENARE